MSRASGAGRSGGQRFGKGAWVLILIVLAGAMFLTATREWLLTELASPAGGTQQIIVAGSEASEVLLAVSLAGVAAALFLSIARRIGRVVGFVILFGIGAAWLASTVSVIVDPGRASVPAVRAATGLEVVADQVSLSAWPYVALVVGALFLIGTVTAAVMSRGWDTSSRFERAQTRPPADADAADDGLDPANSWDAQTRGEDPS
ncbi:Trp biosynthesis-associated membrane protein [Saxibacter everestensis]|uniref:Trp biosynthesis-associated membrane protein n=1 Tax=Saxibacter everestensis TaxID=2909229 RepID=A0ABY8QXM6_9MICO|nr:Trp biosynthesis-associated membrane protein [Brevibacteriaceae bacterium ZFBP1038]